VPEGNDAARTAAKDAALWWVRTHPLQAARFATVAARHPQRTRQAVSGARTLREAAPDPRVRRLGAHLLGPARQAGREVPRATDHGIRLLGRCPTLSGSSCGR